MKRHDEQFTPSPEAPQARFSERASSGKLARDLPYPLARYRKRLLSGLVDYVVLVILLRIVFAVLGVDGFLWDVVAFLVLFGNLVVMQGLTGRSLGKRLTSLQLYVPVETAAGERSFVAPGPLLCFARWWAQLLNLLPVPFVPVGYLWPLFDERGQTFADKVCGTVVMDGPDRNLAQRSKDEGRVWGVGGGRPSSSSEGEDATPAADDPWRGRWDDEDGDGQVPDEDEERGSSVRVEPWEPGEPGREVVVLRPRGDGDDDGDGGRGA